MKRRLPMLALVLVLLSTLAGEGAGIPRLPSSRVSPALPP